MIKSLSIQKRAKLSAQYEIRKLTVREHAAQKGEACETQRLLCKCWCLSFQLWILMYRSEDHTHRCVFLFNGFYII